MPATTPQPLPQDTSERELTWYEQFYAALDAKDITVVDRLCTPDTRVQFGNHEPVQGRDAVRELKLHFWSTIGGMRHTITNVLGAGDETLVEADVEYTRLDGATVVCRAATVLARRDGLIAEQRIYVDVAPLTAGAGGDAAWIEYSTPRIPANPEGQEVELTREQIWQALEWKAEFPTLFVPPIREARLLERYPDGILREILHQDPGGEPEILRERVFYEPARRMTFLRLNGRVLGQIVNAVEQDEGELTLRFAFTLAIEGAEHDGPEERAYRDQFADGYVRAVEGLLEITREAVRTGTDPTAKLAGERAAGVGS